MQQVFDVAFGVGVVFLGCGLLVASALHVIASVDMSPDAIGANARASAARPAVPPKELAAVPMRARAPTRKGMPLGVPKRAPAPTQHHNSLASRSFGSPPPNTRISSRTSFVAPAARAPAKALARTEILSGARNRPIAAAVPRRAWITAAVPRSARIAVTMPRSPQIAATAPPSRQIAVRLQMSAHALKMPVAHALQAPSWQKTARSKGRSGARQAPNVKTLVGRRLHPTLVGVAIDPSAFAPRLEGLRMRGRIVVPTPSPTPPYVPPVSRNGLTPGP